MKKIAKVYVGVDVSKDYLDVNLHPVGKTYRIANSKPAILKLLKQLKTYPIVEFGCEATGGFEKLLEHVLMKQDHVIRVIDPRRIKGFIAARGCKAKTDRIDAQKIAEFIACHPADYQKINRTDSETSVQALVNRRADLGKTLAAEKTRLKHPTHELSRTSIEKHIEFLKQDITSFDKQIKLAVTQNKELHRKAQLLESIPGFGSNTVALLVSFMPELGQVSNKQIAALTGVCPYDRSSGQYQGKKFIKGGRIIPRNALYMCALTTVKFYLPLRKFYEHLRAQNKPAKVALVAVMRKLIVLANTIIGKGLPCQNFA